MKKIIRIAKLEWNVLFYSPVAWLVLIIFFIQCGLTFSGLLGAQETSQHLGNDLSNLTVKIFGDNRGFFAAVTKKLYLYIPLLTMGLMSRELKSGSIKLLFSSPVTAQQIILGKFLAMLSYCFLFALILGSILVAGIFSIENLDISYVLGGILGIFLLTAAYSAIGLFMSSLTSYQVVAAISTLAVLAGLDFIGHVGQSIDFVRDITYWLSISGRVDNFITGLISSKDVIYFLLVISLFLILSVMRLNKGRKTRSTLLVWTRYVALFVGVIAVGYVSSLPAYDGYYDTSRFKANTLTKNTRDLLKQLDAPLTITSYVNLVNSHARLGSPKWRNFDLAQFDKYFRFLPNLKITYVPYYDRTFNARRDSKMSLLQRAKRTATAYGYDMTKVLTPDEIHQRVDLVPEENLFVRYIHYKDKKAPLRMYYDMYVYPHEAEITAAIKRLLVRPPVVGFVIGHGERSIDGIGDKDYKSTTNMLTTRKALINQGFDVIDVSLTDSLPKQLAVLVIADPMKAYSAEEIAKVNRYIQQGGNILIATEPHKQALTAPFLKDLGVSFSEGTLLQESKDFRLDLIQTHAVQATKGPKLTFSSKAIVSMPGAVQINYADTTAYHPIPVLLSDSASVWSVPGILDLEANPPKFDAHTEQKITATLALALTRKLANKTQKIMVMGDADFMSNGELNRRNLRIKNFAFTTAVFKWFSNGEFPVDVSRPKPIDNHIIVSKTEISWIKILFSMVIPIGLFAVGSVTLIRRRRK